MAYKSINNLLAIFHIISYFSDKNPKMADSKPRFQQRLGNREIWEFKFGKDLENILLVIKSEKHWEIGGNLQIFVKNRAVCDVVGHFTYTLADHNTLSYWTKSTAKIDHTLIMTIRPNQEQSSVEENCLL